MTKQTKELLLKTATENAEELYSGAEGLWVSNDQFISDFEEEEYEKFLGAERFEEIQSGQWLRTLRFRRYLSSVWRNGWGDADADVVPGYSLVEVTDSDGNRGIALFLGTGYSFSGLSIRVEEIFDTRAAAMAYLEENGSTWEG
jgi:hypothetical protein